MAELILELRNRPGQEPSFRRFDPGEISIGRGLDNDLIVSDPFVGAHQFRLLNCDGEVQASILDRTNITYLNESPCVESCLTLRCGDTLLVGQTRLRVLSATAPVPPARPILDTRWSRIGYWRVVAAVLMWLLCCAYALFFDYQETVERVNWLQLTTSVLLLGLIVLVWSCAWAAVGQLLRHRAQLASQLFISSAMTWLMMQVTIAAGYLDYASNLTWLSEVFDWVMSALVSILLLHYNLKMATNLRRPLAIACVMIGLLFVVVIAVETLQRHEYSGLPRLETTLKSPFAKLRKGLPLDEKLAELPELFD